MKEAGYSINNIADLLGISHTTVQKWCKRWEQEGELSDRPRCGAPRKTSRADDRKIVEQATTSFITNAVELKNTLQLSVSSTMVRRRLHEDGVHHRPPVTKEVLTERQRNDRLQFAQQYLNEELEFWGRVIFSGEKSFQFTIHGRPHCWRQNGTTYACENICEVTGSTQVCNVWGWMHLHGLGELVEIDGKYTTDKYLEILEEVMVPTVREIASPFPQRILFIQVCKYVEVCCRE